VGAEETQRRKKVHHRGHGEESGEWREEKKEKKKGEEKKWKSERVEADEVLGWRFGVCSIGEERSLALLGMTGFGLGGKTHGAAVRKRTAPLA